MRIWTTIKIFQEILFDFHEGIARITINRPRYRNAFTPLTVSEMSQAFAICREDPRISVVVLTAPTAPQLKARARQNVYVPKPSAPVAICT